MRKSLLLVALCLGACSSAPAAPEGEPANAVGFVDMDGDGLPDARAGAGEFVDTDGDGLPDHRLAPRYTYIDTDDDGLPDTRINK